MVMLKVVFGLVATLVVQPVWSYVYMSVHDAPYNYLAFDGYTGELVSSSILNTGELRTDMSALRWRGMHLFNDTLYVANSKSSTGFIAKYKCKATSRSTKYTSLGFIEYFTKQQSASNYAMDHVYDLDVVQLGTTHGIAVATQNTNSVILYDTLGKPMTLGYKTEYSGAVLTFDVPKGEDGIRGMQVDNRLSLLFVAVKCENAVLVYDIHDIVNTRPKLAYKLEYKGKSTFIGVCLDVATRMAYIGDSYHDAVVALNYNQVAATTKWVTEDIKDTMNHPAGIQVADGVVYVASQNTHHIVKLNAATGAYKGVFADFGDLNVIAENLFIPSHAYMQCDNY